MTAKRRPPTEKCGDEFVLPMTPFSFSCSRYKGHRYEHSSNPDDDGHGGSFYVTWTTDLEWDRDSDV